MKHELCPSYCLFDPESENPGVKATCDYCAHSEDEMIEPRQAVSVFTQQEVTVIARNHKQYYVLSKMQNGEMSLGTVDKKSIRFI